MKDLAVVLVSGGIDSCVTTAIASKDYELALLHINYGQKTEKRELLCFHSIADYYETKRMLVLNLEIYKLIGGSSLITNYELNDTYVPFRNAIFLSLATAWSEVICASKIFIGVVEQDAPEYPDTRKFFIDNFNKVIELGTKTEKKIEIIAPIVKLKKYEVVLLGKKLNAPLHLTWSCYNDNDIACGRCASCLRRIDAFKQAGIDDTIKYNLQVKVR